MADFLARYIRFSYLLLFPLLGIGCDDVDAPPTSITNQGNETGEGSEGRRIKNHPTILRSSEGIGQPSPVTLLPESPPEYPGFPFDRSPTSPDSNISPRGPHFLPSDPSAPHPLTNLPTDQPSGSR